MLLALVAAGGFYFHSVPGPTALDRIGLRIQPSDPHSSLFIAVSKLGTAPVLAGGAAIAALVVVTRDRRRALVCLVAPPVCAAFDQLVLKRLVGRSYLDELSYASGSVVVVATLATAWTLAVPARLRVATTAIGTVAVITMIDAVVGLRWHEPTDALAGAALGVGFVMAADWLAHLVVRTKSPRPSTGARTRVQVQTSAVRRPPHQSS